MRRTIIFLGLLVCGVVPTLAQGVSRSASSIDGRVKKLLSQMTVEEKVAQLRSTWSMNPRVTDALLANGHVMDSLFGKGIGMINPDFDNSPEEQARFRNAIQTYLRIRTRLGIPAIFLDEAHHGLLAQGVDVYPTSIGLACSWDTGLVESIYDLVAGQASRRGTNMVLAPVVDVTRDPRWGRTGETFGEDPFLNGMMGSAVVRGFQGSWNGSILTGHVAATLKHFTGHAEPEGGQNQGPADFPERVLRTFHMEPFRLAVAQAHPAGIMPAYVEIDGVPCHANKWLLTDVLRKEWGYKGVLVSDWWAIDQLYQKHLVAADQRAAALQAFEAGVTVDLPMGSNYARLTELFHEGKIKMADLDRAAGYVLALKFRLGLFDRTDSVSLRVPQVSGRALALRAAEESMVLLKNDGVLPLRAGALHSIAVVGPCAAVNYTGDYSGIPFRSVSLLEGIRRRVGDSVQVLYAKGVDISGNGDTLSYTNFQILDTLVRPDHFRNLRMIDSAVAVALQADVIVCAVGQNEQYSREAEAPHHYGDISSLDLPADQDSLLRALVATGKLVVVYLVHGRPLSVNYAAEHANAILDQWFSGEEAGDAGAAILFGDVNPSGKLTISVPRSVGQLPIYYNHKPSAQFMPYVTEAVTPLYPFGFGLGYSRFKYGAPMMADGVLSVTVTNTGSRDGDEVVQLYVHPKVASVTQPVKALKGFVRVHIRAGESVVAHFVITRDMLAYYTRSMARRAEAGVYEIMVGPDSGDVQRINYTITGER